MSKNAAYAHLPQSLTSLMHQMVYSQDAGYPLNEALEKASIPSMLRNSLMVALDEMRVKMRHAGIPVYARAGSDDALVIGLKDRPFKAPHQCFQHDAQYGEIEDPEDPTKMVDVASCRFCGVKMELQPESESLASVGTDQEGS